MTGVVIETVSWKKLIAFGLALLLFQVAVYLVGGLVAPAPYSAMSVLATKCVDKDLNRDNWFWSRLDNSCASIEHIDDADAETDANMIVFTFQFPTPKSGGEVEMSRWFQSLVGVLMVDVEYQKDGPQFGDYPVMTMQARLGGRNKDEPVSNWTLLAWSTITRRLECRLPDHLSEQQPEDQGGALYDCTPLPLYEVGSCHYDYYLLNIRVPAFDRDRVNEDIGKLIDMHLVSIHQNGGFTKVWFSLKAVFFPILLTALIWYWVRVVKQRRDPNLLEKTLFSLGVAISFLNLPVEFFTLWLYMPYMQLFSDIRQGLFLSVLLCFWIIFAGEHLMDSVKRDGLVMYWKHLSGVILGCICLFVFEMCERGVQLKDPFHSIWSTDTSSKVGYAFVILAGIAACVYFLFLFYMIVRVFRNISAKRSNLESMSRARRNKYIGIIYRFKCMMATTLLCAAMTVVFFIVGQISESQWKWDEEESVQHTSAFLTGVYGMWNLYIFGLLILYAPSHKYIQASTTDNDESEEETVEFTTMPSEASVIASFARKTAAD